MTYGRGAGLRHSRVERREGGEEEKKKEERRQSGVPGRAQLLHTDRRWTGHGGLHGGRVQGEIIMDRQKRGRFLLLFFWFHYFCLY